MNRNRNLLTILAVLILGFVALLIMLINRLPTANNQVTKQVAPADTTVTSTPMAIADLLLEPPRVLAASGQAVRIKMKLRNLPTSVEAADIVLNYNPELLRFVAVENVNPNFSNPRALSEDNRLVLSFINKGTEIGTLDNPGELTLGEVVFTAQGGGTSQIVPDISGKQNSSLVLGLDSDTNQLTSSNSVEINIE